MCLVSDILIRSDFGPSMNWSWKKEPTSKAELEEFEELSEFISQVLLNMGVDEWRWEGDANGCFSVAGVRGWLSKINVGSSDYVLDWCKWVPDKCNIFMWRALLDRLPTKTALSRRNIDIGNTQCIFCDESEETVDHVFTGCGFSMTVWEGILRWCSLPNFFVFSLKDVIEMHRMDGLSPLRKEIIRGVVMTCCWRIWRARNEMIFDDKRCKVVEIVADVKAISFL
ncbi:uncharacterized protein LOC143580751 [Bidens hawaiensis]|uniref:uncharacterized protein LOC143580751 n=1 Tax=Bidens hawaiensis TaxID=980011 RepID=UPI004049C4D9